MMATSPRSNARTQATTTVLAGRLKQCWSLEFNWEHIPEIVQEVSLSIDAIPRGTGLEAHHVHQLKPAYT